MGFFSDKWRGIVLCAVLAVPCWFLGKLVPVVGAPVFAILLGMLVALVWPVQAAFKSGVGFVSKKVLQYAVILLGFGLNISVVLATGKQSLPIIVFTIATSLIVAYVLHKVMKIPGKISTLIGVGSSICGGSAVAATAPVIKADDEEVAQAISVIFSSMCWQRCFFLGWVQCWDFLQQAVKPSVFLLVLLLTILLRLRQRRRLGMQCSVWERQLWIRR